MIDNSFYRRGQSGLQVHDEDSFVATSLIELYDVMMLPYIDVQKTLEARQRRDIDNKGLPAHGNKCN